MKTSIQENHIHPALFRIAAIVGNPVTPMGGKSASALIRKEFAAFRKEIGKSLAADFAKPQPKLPVEEGCGWSFPIRK